MGWTSQIISSKQIDESTVQDIINNLPDEFSRLGNPKQTWGWPCYADVNIPNGNILCIGGAYGIVPLDKAELFVSYFKDELSRRGHDSIMSTPVK